MILTIITFIIMLSVLVVVHEYGHFLFARLCGIKIKEFSIGFGPKLFTWLKKNDTDFNVRAYPLGGFVSMAGESLDEMDDKYGFQAQPAWKRFLVIFAGPLFSFIFAVLIFISIGFFFGFPTGENSNKIQMVLPQSKASEIGLRSGDEIFAVNGIKSVNGSYIDIIHNSVGKELTLTVKRNNKTLTFNAAPDLMLRFLGVNTKVSPNHNGVIFDSVSRETILYKKGVSNNDILISVNGIDVNSTVELKNVLDNIHTEKLSLVVESGHNLKTINVKYTPFYYELGDFKLFFPERYFLSDKDNVSLYGLKSEDKLLKINGNEIFTDKGFLKYSNDTIKSITVERNEKNINIFNRKISKTYFFISRRQRNKM